MVSFIKLNSLPAVILSLIVGTLIGDLVDIENKVKNGFKDSNKYMDFYVLVAATLCFSGTNIFGAMNEAMTGDMTILLSKAVMDIFAGTIFTVTLGYAMNLIVIPQFVILSLLFYGAKFIKPFITDTMLPDFIAVGGVITFIIGKSIAEIKRVSAINILPALIFVFPVSYIFSFM